MDERGRIGDLDALQRALRPCRRCVAAGIRVESMPVVSGGRDADAILVGQAPGVRERDNLLPFSGPAGRRLREWLEPAGLGDEASFYGRLYIAAVVRCFPGKAAGGAGVRPAAALVRACVPWQRRARERVPAPRGVAGGTLALAELAPGVRLDDAVGAPRLALADGRPLYALPHPSGASTWPHLPGNAERLERALRMIAGRLGGGGSAN